MNSLFDVLTMLGERPQILGNRSCEKLAGFLLGWKNAAEEFVCPPQDPNLHELCSFISDKYGIHGAYDVFTVCLLVAGNDADAFDAFFEHLAAMKKVRPEYFASDYVHRGQYFPFKERKDVLNYIATHPHTTIGRKTVTRLRGFLDGDFYCRSQSEAIHSIYANLNDIEEWRKSLWEHGKTVRCEALALVQCGGDEVKAFDWLIKEIHQYEERE